MLGDHPINIVLLATDLDAIKEYYTNKIGLQILEESAGAIRFKCGGDSEISYTKSAVGTADTQTQASFRVPDVAAEVAELRSRGVKIEEYDTPGLKTVDGIADRGFALISWFVDPAGNCISMMQVK
jgi:catechol-2,3-dioxygenase